MKELQYKIQNLFILTVNFVKHIKVGRELSISQTDMQRSKKNIFKS